MEPCAAVCPHCFKRSCYRDTTAHYNQRSPKAVQLPGTHTCASAVQENDVTIYRKKTDSNHTEIAAILRQVGCSVVDLSRVGQGVPDLLWGRVVPCRFCGAHTPQAGVLEVKTAAGKLNEKQIAFHDDWRGPIAIARDMDDVLRAVGVKP